jgi:hypothetical protein
MRPEHHALQIHAGPRALAHLRERGLQPADVRLIPAAAGGPKGLVLNALDRFLFGQWLAGEGPSVHLVGASIGAWRMASACQADADAALLRMAEAYVEQHYDHAPGKAPTSRHVSTVFAATLAEHFEARQSEMLAHPRLRLHVVASRGRHLLRREHLLTTPLGYLGAWSANALHRRALGGWLQRVVFSDPREPLPLALHDLSTRQVDLTPGNLNAAVLASCSIPFWLRAVHDIPGAPRGAYWDGGLTDYHFHWPFAQLQASAQGGGLVLYPHFQPRVVPGWLDKPWRRRHRPTPWLDNLILLCPSPDWIATLPDAKLPDRDDFRRYGDDVDARAAVWRRAVRGGQRLADELQDWLARGAPVDRVLPLL